MGRLNQPSRQNQESIRVDLLETGSFFVIFKKKRFGYSFILEFI